MACLFGLYGLLVVSTRIVSIASIACTIALPIMAAVLKEPLEYVIACCLMSAIVLWAHRGNFRRLWRREERRVTFPWNKKKLHAVQTGGDPAGDV
jgi:glycerol-3-phosphate acyltransferase PlsY